MNKDLNCKFPMMMILCTIAYVKLVVALAMSCKELKGKLLHRF